MTFDRTIFVGKFTQEAQELIQKINAGLLALEQAPESPEALKDLMRVAHTLKGAAKIMRFNQVSGLAHKLEELLSGAQEGRLRLTAPIIDLLFTSADALGQCIAAILARGDDELDLTALSDVLDRAAQGEEIAAGLAQLKSSARVVPADAGEIAVAPPLPAKPGASPHVEATIRVEVDRLDQAVRLVGEIAVSHKKSARMLALLKELHRLARKHAKQLEQAFRRNGGGVRTEAQQDMLYAGRQLLQGLESVFKESRDEAALLEMVINDLSEDVLKMRMLPLATVFDTFPRAVRDMAKHFQKELVLRLTGAETTLDKKIIEKLNGPLIHLLRNCIDHGIEPPAERIARGKPAAGLISISAQQKSGAVEITIADDGRGVPLEQLKQRVLKRGLVTEEQIRSMKESDLLNLIFLPGVSTSEIITDISGRGLGMEIVKTELEQLKGTVAFSSAQGQGTQCVLTVPVTLTTLRSLIIAAHGQRFAAPLHAIEETAQIAVRDLIDVVGYQALRLRNQMIYVADLADVLKLPHQRRPPQEQVFLLIARAEGMRVGLIVDGILDEQDVVVKQLPGHLRQAKTIAGATISSENTILLILHLPEIVKLVRQAAGKRAADEAPAPEVSAPRILVVEDSSNTGEIEKRILEAHGYAVDLAKDGLDALNHAQQTKYDLIITDIEMPRMDGFTLTENLRQTTMYAEIPIMIVTSLERASDKKRGIRAGANAYLTKDDFEQKYFIDTVKSLITSCYAPHPLSPPLREERGRPEQTRRSSPSPFGEGAGGEVAA